MKLSVRHSLKEFCVNKYSGGSNVNGVTILLDSVIGILNGNKGTKLEMKFNKNKFVWKNLKSVNSVTWLPPKCILKVY